MYASDFECSWAPFLVSQDTRRTFENVKMRGRERREREKKNEGRKERKGNNNIQMLKV